MNLVELGSVLKYEQPTKYIVENTNYSDSYKTPVLTAGQSFLLGYTNETDNIFNNVPVIIFDDFTTATKYVDFPFKVKSSAMKILKADNNKANIRFLFYLMQTIKIDNEQHKRYWISKYSKLKVKIPPLSEQKRITYLLDQADKLRQLNKQLINKYDELTQSLFLEMFGDPFINPKEWKKVEISKLSERLFAGGDVPKENFTKEKTKLYNVPIYSNGLGEKALYGYTDIKKVIEDAITISARGTIGYPEIRKAPFYPVIRLIILIPKKDLLHIVYLKNVISYLNFDKGGSSIPQLTVPMIKNRKIPLPPLSLQTDFANRVALIEQQKAKAQEALQKSDDLFNCLLQQSFKK